MNHFTYWTYGIGRFRLHHPLPCKLPCQWPHWANYSLPCLSPCPWSRHSHATSLGWVPRIPHMKQSPRSHPDSYDALLEPLVHPVGISRDVNLSTLTWSTRAYNNTPFSYAKDSPVHEPQFIGVNFAGCLCIASFKCIIGQLLHHRDCLWNHEEHDSWKCWIITMAQRWG